MHEPYLNDKLNLETARIHWEELQAHFARGAAVFVDNSLDLIDTARLMADNNSHEIGKLMAEGKFGLVTEQQARQFLVHNNQSLYLHLHQHNLIILIQVDLFYQGDHYFLHIFLFFHLSLP